VRFVEIAALALASASCVLGPEPRLARHVALGTYCSSRETFDRRSSRGGAEEASAPAIAAAPRGYAPRALDAARAIGALGQVERLAEAHERGATASELADLRGQVNDTITMATLDLASTTADLACEEGRASQVASDLRAAEQAQTRRLAAYSLVLGAGAAVIGGVLAVTDKNQVPGGVVGIAGGVAGGTFGFATLAVRRSTTFRHARNILGEVWRGEAHPSVPDVVWGYLTRPQFSRTADRTVRDALIASWKESGTLGDDPEHPAAARVALYFGEGGTYDADGLDDRANMLSDVREVVSLMNYGLEHLANEVADR
jgi:hypothetical protein